MKKFLLYAVTAIAMVASFTSCDKEEDIALSMSGVWETTDVLFPRTYKGQPMNPVKTVIVFEHGDNRATVGSGYAVEYFNNQELPVAYYHIRWETWTRTSTGEVGIEIDYYETSDIFKTIEPDYDLRDSEFFGQCTINQVPGTQAFRFIRGTAPDVSKVKFWGYDELIPTWHPVSYEGQIDLRRTYQGQTYRPTSVVITFDVDPQFNNSICGFDKAYVRENYDNAPWGTYLADSIRHWNITSNKELSIYLYNSDDSFGDYLMWDVTATADSLIGDFFVDTNIFTHFNLKRIANPDWSAIKEWGIVNRLKE